MNIRELAVRSLLLIWQDGGYSNIVVSRMIKKYALSDRDRRFYTELVYGTLRYMAMLDRAIGMLSKRSLQQMDAVCAAILRLGLYQLQYLDKVPPSAACYEAVALARKMGHEGMAKFVNAVLRNALRRPEVFVVPSRQEDEVLHLALTYHQQNWFIRRCLQQYGFEETVKLCRFFDTIPELCVRIQTQKISREKAMAMLAEKGIVTRPGRYAPESLYIETNDAVQNLELLTAGRAMIQDEASQLVAHVLDPQPGDVVLDVCAAPGGKTTHIASLGGPDCLVYGADIYEHKLQLIRENAKKLQLSNIRTILQDAVRIGERFPAKADRVLVDAPCSGLGILRRKLDLRWRKKEQDLIRLPSLQTRILNGAAACVKTGGILVYSTCTINTAENAAVVEAFLQRHTEFTLLRAGETCSWPQPGKYIDVLPQRDGIDGFFIAKMRRDS